METETRIVFRVYWGNIGIIEQKMETLGPLKGIYWGIYWGYIGIMEKMEIIGTMGYILRYTVGLYFGNGKENGTYRDYKG